MNAGVPNPVDLLEKFNPFGVAGDIAGKAVADGWTGIMMALWSSGLWVLRTALGVMDQWMTPDISAEGPAAEVYRTTFWGAGVLVALMAFVQLGVAAFRRDSKSLARVFVGALQFGAVWSGAIAYGVAVIAACSGLSRALMESLLGINEWSNWTPMQDADFGKTSIEVGLATVLGILALFLWIAAIGHFVVMLTRAAALLILAATTPIAAAGLVSDAGRSWFWKSMRWFHAAALTPVLTVLMMGLGVKLTTGVSQGGAKTAEAAVGTAFPGVMLILVSVVAPVALFKLLAFVDPGTSSGASMRAGMSSAGGLQGLMSGGSQGTTSAASQSTGGGQSQGEAQSNEATTSRFGSALSGVTGGAGSLFSAGMGAVAAAGATAASVGIDQMNQTGVGDSSYYPDYQQGSSQRFNPDQRDATSGASSSDKPDEGQKPAAPQEGSASGAQPVPSVGAAGTPSSEGGSSGKSGSGAGEAATAVKAVPPVA